MQPTTGSRFGPYEITGPLGVGGMGEVYRARDTTLGRDVALKFVPEVFTSDPERMMRFEREARTLAMLNHPNIAQIYGVETSGTTRGIVMELVEGSTLAEVIAAGAGSRESGVGGGLAVDEALPIAQQIITALEAAHDASIVHRDLKPANIKVRPDGTVKVLDFGIAKAMDPGAGDGEPGTGNAANSPTITTPAMTLRGIILGTAAYMSPEQARGRFVDKRADIWAFGCVLYEMLTGRRAFDGEDATDTLAAVVRAEPDWTLLPPGLPPSIRLVLQNCLIKDPSKRLASISTASFLLGSPLEVHVSNGATPAVSRSRGRAIVVGAVAVVVFGAVASTIAWRLKPPPTPSVMRFSVPLADGQELSGRGGQILAVSPDGTQLAYSANRQLFVRRLSEPTAVPVIGTNNVQHPVFSPDGQSIAFVADNALKRIGVSGGTALTLCPVVEIDAGISWHGDAILFAQPNGIFSVPASGGKPELIVPIKGERVSTPHMLPDGRTVLLAVTTSDAFDRWDKGQVVLHSLASGQRRVVIESGADPRYLKSGHLAYAAGGVVFAVPFDANRLEITGTPVPAIEGVSRSIGAANASLFAVSETGTLAFLPGSTAANAADRNLAFLENGSTQPLGLPRSGYFTPRVSPNGRSLAFGVETGTDADLWIYEFDRGAASRRLTFGGHNRYPAWSPDGKRLAFQSDREGDLAIFSQSADGTGKAERLTKPETGTAHVPYSWSPDGARLLFGVATGDLRSLWSYTFIGGKSAKVNQIESNVWPNAVFSPDGRWIAYVMGGAPLTRLFVQPFPPTGALYLVSRPETQGNNPFWSVDGKQLFYGRGPGDYAVSKITTQPTLSVGVATSVPAGGRVAQGQQREYDLMPDGKRLVVIVGGAGNVGRAINVVLNWFEELNARVPRTR